MIEISDKARCCGCEACILKCPKQCINFIEDEEGFSYPKVEESLCVDCGWCEKVCPLIHSVKNNDDRLLKPYSIAAYNKDEGTVRCSTSAGIFTLLAEKIIKKGGIVYGATYDCNWQVGLKRIDGIEELSQLRGSKYVQSSTINSYQEVELLLKQGKNILYSGVPCQIAGLKGYLRKQYENLFCVEVACHGVPSPVVWQRYLCELKKGTKEISTINFRYKPEGWKGYRFKVNFTDGTSLDQPRGENSYLRAFLEGLSERPSCFDCQFRDGKSMADMTLADFWGVEKLSPDMNYLYGCNLVIIRSERGMTFFPFEKTVYKEICLEEAVNYNQGLKGGVQPHRKRSQFFDRINHGEEISKVVSDLLAPSLQEKMIGFAKKVKSRLSRT